MFNAKEVRELALAAATGTPIGNFTMDDVNAALVGELSKSAGSINQFMKNRYDIYDIIVSVVEEVVPKKVIDVISPFAEVKTVKHGQTVAFTQKLGRNRARKFLTQAAPSGVYETFRLDHKSFKLEAHAIGGAVTVDFERLLDGSETMADVMEIITTGLIDSVYLEIQKALISAVQSSTDHHTANSVVGSWNADHMFRLIQTVKSYGDNAVIFAPPEFVAAMGLTNLGSEEQLIYMPGDLESVYKTGYISMFKGTPIVQLPQSFIDDSNTNVWIDPRYAYVFPSGKAEKVVKILFEGETQINDFKNRDNSLEVHVYKKLGAGILTTNNWGIYKNTGIKTPTFLSPYGI